MCLSQTTGYAVYALSCMDDSIAQPRRIRDIAEHTGLPKAYLARIVSQLARSGIIRSKRGYRGGIVLTRPARELSLLQVVEAVEGKNWLGACLLGLDHCEGLGVCPTQTLWKRLRDEIPGVLQTTTLADVMRCAGGGQAGPPRRSGRRSQRTAKRRQERKAFGPSEPEAGAIPACGPRAQTTHVRASRSGAAGRKGATGMPASAKST